MLQKAVARGKRTFRKPPVRMVQIGFKKVQKRLLRAAEYEKKLVQRKRVWEKTIEGFKRLGILEKNREMALSELQTVKKYADFIARELDESLSQLDFLGQRLNVSNAMLEQKEALRTQIISLSKKVLAAKKEINRIQGRLDQTGSILAAPHN